MKIVIANFSAPIDATLDFRALWREHRRPEPPRTRSTLFVKSSARASKPVATPSPSIPGLHDCHAPHWLPHYPPLAGARVERPHRAASRGGLPALLAAHRQFDA